MKELGAGHIVNVASNAGIASLPEMASYNATKAAMISLSETLRAELAEHDIGVTAVYPSFVKNNLMESFHCTDESQRDGRFIWRFKRRFPELYSKLVIRFNAKIKERLLKYGA